MMAERGLSVVRTTIMRWVRRYVPEFERWWNRFSRPAGRSLQVVASHRAVREMKADGELNRVTKVRSSKYLNHLIEQDHRGVKSRLGPMLGLCFGTAAIAMAGVELLHRQDP